MAYQHPVARRNEKPVSTAQNSLKINIQIIKRTIITLLALAGIAVGDEVLVEYDFTGNTPLSATQGTGGMQVYKSSQVTGDGYSVENGTLTMSGATGFYSASGANQAIYLNDAVDSWSFTLNATLDSGNTCYSVLQFGGKDFTTNSTAIGFYMGNGASDRGLFGFEIKNAGRWGVVMDSSTQTALGLTYDNVATSYTISVYNNELHLEVGGIDVTSYITRVDTDAGTTTFASAFSNATRDGICWTKLGYATR